MSDLLFTYGTLRLNQSHPMATYLSENAELAGLALLPKARIYKVDWYPALIKTDDEKDNVVGDVFLLKNNDALTRLDDYEGIGNGQAPYEYRRENVTIILNGENKECWVYFYNHPLPENAEWIESGDFLNP